MKRKKIEPIVENLLRLYPKTREDDFYLIGSVYITLAPEIKNKTFLNIIKNHQYYGLPSFASITRSRRKLQAKYQDLASAETGKIREKEELEYFKHYRANKKNN